MRRFLERLAEGMTAVVGVILGVPLLAASMWQQRANEPAIVILGAVMAVLCAQVIASGLRGILGRQVHWWPEFPRPSMPWLVLSTVLMLPACFFLGYVLIYAASVQLTGAPPSWLPWQ